MSQGYQLKTRYPEPRRKKRGNSLELPGIDKGFLNRTSTAQALRTANKWDFVKLTSFYMAEDTVILIKQQSTDWEDIFTNYTSARRLVARLFKGLKN